MYIARIRVKNFRCFQDMTVDFQPGLNVIIGENNAGKTTLLKALSLVFERRGRTRPTCHDFHRLIEPLDAPPRITISATIRSSATDTPADRALVASWLTKLDAPWEAQLTYTFFLPEQHLKEFTTALAGTTDRRVFFEVVDEFLPMFVSRIYAGNPDTLVTADSESLTKFDCQFLDALRDVESEMFAGSTPLFRSMLEEVLDHGKPAAEKRGIRKEFRTRSNTLRDDLVKRLDTKRLFDLVNVTGASDGGHPKLEGGVEETDLIAALRLFIDREQFTFPATHQGLGYNNLLYISLLLASLSFRASVDKRGQNAAIFPMLLIEEPEAHLHPALQYKLLAHIVSRVQAEPNHNRQVFVTTHSTHITSAARLGPIICLSLRANGEVRVSYPAKLFPQTPEGQASKNYVERYLDATKSTMLFSKATVLVEGIAEQLVVPALAALLNRSFDQHHVALVRVDGLTFKHFLPLFGAGVTAEMKPFALDRQLACIVDADPCRKEKGVKNAKWKSCFPFQIDRDATRYEYHPLSGTVRVLQLLQTGQANIGIFHGKKTLEYDLSLENHAQAAVITSAMKNADDLRTLVTTPDNRPASLEDFLEKEESDDLTAVAEKTERHRHQFAALYLRCAEDGKGEHAFALEQALRSTEVRTPAFVCPEYIRKAVEWVTGGSASPASGTT